MSYPGLQDRFGEEHMALAHLVVSNRDVKGYSEAAFKLHRFLSVNNWNGKGLVGPDVGVRFNARIGRFIKSCLPQVAWQDSYYYLQAQGYWVLANWRLFVQTGGAEYREIAVRCSEHMIERQRSDGAWDYPNPEWGGRVATAEGTWGSLGLLETYRHTRDERFLVGVLRWHSFLFDKIGFERIGDEWSVNYFSGKPTSRVPNNSAFVLRFLAELADVTGDMSYRDACPGMIAFLARAQKPSGEFPYQVRGTATEVRLWEHYLCFQYNAFQCMDLMRYYQLTRDTAALPLVSNCLRFLLNGVTGDGHAACDCRNRHREIIYSAAALGAAFASARELDIEGFEESADHSFGYLLQLQRPNGSFPFSRRDYYLLSDKRPYPRSLAMILFHLLIRIEAEGAGARCT
jgi:hypothetical protein